MSWRETLGVTPSTETPYAHNSQNTQNAQNAQKPTEQGNCADIADSAYEDREQEASRLLEALADAGKGLAITPTEVKDALGAKDIEDWRKGAISVDSLAAFARLLVERNEMDQGKRPAHYTEHAFCQQCGPVWLWFSGKVLGCPWCWNHAAERPIPRPCAVSCGDCLHFQRSHYPHLGHCAKGEPEGIVGIWETEQRFCKRFLLRPKKSQNNQLRPIGSEERNEFPK